VSEFARLLVLYVAAVNPLRLLGTVRGADPAGSTAGGLVSLAGILLLAALSEPLLDGLDISEPTARVAAGLVAASAGLWHLIGPRPQAWEAASGLRSGLVPIAFPVLLRPEVALLAVSAGADEGVLSTAVAAAVGIAIGVLALRRSAEPPRVARAGARLLGAVLVLLGIDLVVDGVLDV
jgi:small neutral amino acid transporter SnatA (MarC family)